MKITHGFSLLEILITLSIIAISLTIAIPALGNFWNKSKEQVLSAQLLRAINLTRNAAISQTQRAILCKSADQETCSGNWQDGFIVSIGEQVLYRFQNFSAEGVLNWRAFPRNLDQVEFLPSGIPSAVNGTFWFCPSKATQPSWAIVLNQSGRARSINPDKNGKILDDKGIALIC